MDSKELIGKQVIFSVDSPKLTVYTIKKDYSFRSGLILSNDDGDYYNFSAETVTINLQLGWRFVATDKQIEWLTELRKNKDLIFSERHIIDKLLHTKPVPYYTIADRDRLNELIHSYK